MPRGKTCASFFLLGEQGSKPQSTLSNLPRTAVGFMTAGRKRVVGGQAISATAAD
jgi:hypothetical protein